MDLKHYKLQCNSPYFRQKHIGGHNMKSTGRFTRNEISYKMGSMAMIEDGSYSDRF